MKKLLFLSIALLSVSSMSFAASLSSLNTKTVTNALNDKTITTISAATLDGKIISDSFTGYFNKDGKVKGKFANKPEDGPQTDEGSWKVKSDGKMCINWNHWNGAKEKCVILYKLNNALLVANVNNDFESLILNNNMKSGDQM